MLTYGFNLFGIFQETRLILLFGWKQPVKENLFSILSKKHKMAAITFISQKIYNLCQTQINIRLALRIVCILYI